MDIKLSKRDLEIIVQSLDHCLATCESPRHGKKAGCEDCGSGKELNQRIKEALKSIKG